MELNPTHPITSAMREQWHKIVALMMIKQGIREVVITMSDLVKLCSDTDLPTVLCHDSKDGMRIILFNAEKEALAYVAAHKGDDEGFARGRN